MRMVFAVTVFLLGGGVFLGSYVNQEQPAAKVMPERDLTTIRRLCGVYYEWRGTKPGDPELDQICFETQEMKP